MRLSMTGLFRAKWSHAIHEEWMGHVLERYSDKTRADVERTRDLMDRYAMDAIVFDYENLMPGLKLPDPKDIHVLAAAIRGRADVIVTFNLQDFPEDYLKQFDIIPQHPDDFVAHQFTLNAGQVCAAAKQHRASLQKTKPSVPDYVDLIQRIGLPKTAAILSSSGYRDLI
jgi:hypothetical protein